MHLRVHMLITSVVMAAKQKVRKVVRLIDLSQFLDSCQPFCRKCYFRCLVLSKESMFHLIATGSMEQEGMHLKTS